MDFFFKSIFQHKTLESCGMGEIILLILLICSAPVTLYKNLSLCAKTAALCLQISNSFLLFMQEYLDISKDLCTCWRWIYINTKHLPLFHILTSWHKNHGIFQQSVSELLVCNLQVMNYGFSASLPLHILQATCGRKSRSNVKVKIKTSKWYLWSNSSKHQ